MLVQKMVKNVRNSKFLKALTGDVKISIEIDTEDRPKQRKGKVSITTSEVQEKPVEYKGYSLRQDKEGEFDIFAPGGALVAHTSTKALAEKFVDNTDMGI